jgi:hypothetical protein
MLQCKTEPLRSKIDEIDRPMIDKFFVGQLTPS